MNRSDTELFPAQPVASHPSDCSSPTKEVYYGRPRTDVVGGPGGPGWTNGHLSSGYERDSYGRTSEMTMLIDHVNKHDLSYQPPPEPDRTWKLGAPPVHHFSFEDRGRARMFPYKESDVTTFTKREPHNYSVNGGDEERYMAHIPTDVTDPHAYERSRGRLLPSVRDNAYSINLGAGALSPNHSSKNQGMFWTQPNGASTGLAAQSEFGRPTPSY